MAWLVSIPEILPIGEDVASVGAAVTDWATGTWEGWGEQGTKDLGVLGQRIG